VLPHSTSAASDFSSAKDFLDMCVGLGVVAATAVFLWLPLLAFGILGVRALTPLLWMVGKAEWLLKDGEKHPLKVVGTVAAGLVLTITGLQTIV
jgi:hypothetical protein